jgi:hypothetical protein
VPLSIAKDKLSVKRAIYLLDFKARLLQGFAIVQKIEYLTDRLAQKSAETDSSQPKLTSVTTVTSLTATAVLLSAPSKSPTAARTDPAQLPRAASTSACPRSSRSPQSGRTASSTRASSSLRSTPR